MKIKERTREPNSFEQYRIDSLTRYNDERARGLVHVEAWVEYMKTEQAWYDEHWKVFIDDES